MKTYNNPIAKNGDFADPFILKYNGIYYLYCTNPDVKCWSSYDLLSWKYEGTVIPSNQFDTLVPFAPEVVYWNGYFYMYTSPSGFGHYVLRSEEPTGPFYKITDNIGHNIDGSVFIDDEDQWYFYWADDAGIKVCEMEDPIKFGEEIQTEAFMDGWTEGPFIMKKDGYYFMTFTGNHYLSAGYRINSAVSNNPVYGFKPEKDNPIVIHTVGKGIGLGHSCSILGPDLITYYIIYHNLNNDATRDLNIDRLGFNGSKMVVFGPTTQPVPVPGLPKSYNLPSSTDSLKYWRVIEGELSFDGEYITAIGDLIAVSEFEIDSIFVAEFNLKAKEHGGDTFGVLFSYKDNKNYGRISFYPEEKVVEVLYFIDGNVVKSKRGQLSKEYDFTKLHSIRLEQSLEGSKIYVDNRLKVESSVENFVVGKIGYYSKGVAVCLGYTALTYGKNDGNVYTDYKPIPGKIEAIHTLSEIRGVVCTEGIQCVELNDEQSILDYHINVSDSANYSVDFYLSNVEENTIIEVWLDGLSLMEGKPLLKYLDGSAHMESMKNIWIEEGQHTIRIRLLEGKATIHRFELYKSSTTEPFNEGKLFLNEEMKEIGTYYKDVRGESGWSDYSVEMKVHRIDGLNGGIIFRVSDEAEGGEGKDTYLGRNFYKGYYAGFLSGELVLMKQNYSEEVLSKKEDTYKSGEVYHLRVHVKGNQIDVFVDDMEKPKISYWDELPFSHGKVGICVKGAVTTMSNFRCSLL